MNDGSTTLEDRLGAVADLELAIRSRHLQDDIMVVRHGLDLHLPLQHLVFLLIVARHVVLLMMRFCVCRLQETCFVLIRTLTLLKLFVFLGLR